MFFFMSLSEKLVCVPGILNAWLANSFFYEVEQYSQICWDITRENHGFGGFETVRVCSRLCAAVGGMQLRACFPYLGE